MSFLIGFTAGIWATVIAYQLGKWSKRREARRVAKQTLDELIAEARSELDRPTPQGLIYDNGTLRPLHFDGPRINSMGGRS